MSAICVSSLSCASRVSSSLIAPDSCSTLSCSFMVIQPVWRHGFEIEAFAKHPFFAPSLANSEVSTISALMYCR